MFMELHLIQNFSPSCLNRDDTNAPKDCVFGGVRRARISSQCIKRSVRHHAGFRERLGPEHLGVRSKNLADQVAKRLAPDLPGVEDEAVRSRALERLIASLGLELAEGKTEYLLFLGEDAILGLAAAAAEHWDQLVAADGAKGTDAATTKKGRKKPSKADASPLDKDAKKRLRELLTKGTGAADVALFGRMVADDASMNIDAACQVAHAISTHEVQMEMDFYTAVDDLTPESETGAGMMGMVEFNSACFYRYSLLDLDQLRENLRGDDDLARRTARAFVDTAIRAIPTGKQNSMAAHNPPSLIYVSIRERGGLPRNLAGAFERPIRVGRDKGLVASSIEALVGYRDRLNAAYGDDGACDLFVCCDVDADLGSLQERRTDSVAGLLDEVESAISQPVA